MKGILVSEDVERRQAAALEAAAPGIVRQAFVDGEEPLALDEVEVAYFSGELYPGRSRPFARTVLSLPSLRWIHTFSAGVDDRFFQRLLEAGVRITTSSGAHAVPIAHTAILYVLALSRDLPGWMNDQAVARWNPREVLDLQGRRLVVVGLGPIGLEVARLGQALRMEVIGLRRSPRGDEPCETRPLADLRGVLPEAHAVVLALPLNRETRGILGAPELRLLSPEAVLVNVGRGDLVDEDALVAALEAGQLGGAGLDVFREEPLPAESPLWRHPRVIVTPHSSGTCPENLLRADEIFLDNLARYRQGEALRNEVAGS